MKAFCCYLVLLLSVVVGCYLLSEERKTRDDGVVAGKPEDEVAQQTDGHTIPSEAPEHLTEKPDGDSDIQPEFPLESKVPSKGYYEAVLSLRGEALKEGLHRLVRRHRVLTYGQLWGALMDLDQGGEQKVILIYSRVQRAAANHGGNQGMWNREHLWPRAYGISRSSPANTDLHHIRASDVGINALRGHLFFDETEGGSSSGDTYSSDNDSWEPPRVVKGDIARAMFYMAVRYEGGEANEVDLELSNQPNISQRMLGKLFVLLEWHRLDPVSEEEKVRNEKIFRSYQGNRNPFIDHPEFAQEVFLAQPRGSRR